MFLCASPETAKFHTVNYIRQPQKALIKVEWILERVTARASVMQKLIGRNTDKSNKGEVEEKTTNSIELIRLSSVRHSKRNGRFFEKCKREEFADISTTTNLICGYLLQIEMKNLFEKWDKN